MEQMHITHSEALYDRAKELMPGGVNSPVRALQTAKNILIISAPGDR